jgi:hypothetical protein
MVNVRSEYLPEQYQLIDRKEQERIIAEMNGSV